jgi:hypothetical protein
MSPKPIDPKLRFAKYLKELDNGCIEFTGGGTDRYGIFWYNGKSIGAHQFAYISAFGPIPDGLFVCHRCDFGFCVNPQHLFLGTPQENTLDMVRKKRNNPPSGSRAHTSKLIESDIPNIILLNETMSQAQIAERYGITPSVISRIVNGHYWKHVTRHARPP